MKTLHKTLAVLLLIVLAAPVVQAAAADVPNINERGDDERAFAEKLAVAVVQAARTSVKTADLEEFETKMPKEGRTEWHLTASFKGTATRKAYKADIVVLIDTSDPDEWEVLRIEYSDTSKSLVGFNRKNVNELRKKLNEK